ncbi:hypothetical protein WLQ65_13690 [Pseudoalteromonas piscicida]|uniref:hypothetical protein n=1 Tax=Pseudoalteromonas piscicida TaxID=43662 RepID=UPI0030C9E8AF
MNKRPKRNFSPEFWLEAAQLVVDLNYSFREAVNAMSVNLPSMDKWAWQLNRAREREFLNIDIHLVLCGNVLDLIRDEIDTLFKISNEPPQGVIARSVIKIEHLVAASTYIATHSITTHPKALVQHS